MRQFYFGICQAILIVVLSAGLHAVSDQTLKKLFPKADEHTLADLQGVRGRDQEWTAAIAGRVIDASNGMPVSGATVAMSSRTIRKTATTDAHGRFSMTDLVPGSYGIVASAPEYIPGGYGQLWPRGAAASLQISKSLNSKELVIPLWRFAAITGTITDNAGKTLRGIHVHLIYRPTTLGDQTAVVRQVLTDDEGSYRFDNVYPGKYIVGAIHQYYTASEAGIPTIRALDSLAPTSNTGELLVARTTFYPHAYSLTEATLIPIRAGDMRTGVDFDISTVPAVRVSGVVSGFEGPTGAHVSLTPVGSAETPISDKLQHVSTVTDKTGRFTLLGVPVGDFILRAWYRPTVVTSPRLVTNKDGRVVVAGSASDVPLSETDPLLEERFALPIASADVLDLMLTLKRGPSVRGELRFDGQRSPPNEDELAGASAVMRPLHASDAVAAVVDRKGVFQFPTLFAGRYIFTPPSLIGWTVTSVLLNGEEVRGRALDLEYSLVNSLVVTFSDRAPTINGTVVTDSGQPNSQATVFILPSDTRLWQWPQSTTVMMQAIRTNLTGQFSSGPLHPSRYSVVAVEDATFDFDWREPEVLRILQTRATQIVAQGTQNSTVTLRAVRFR